MAEPIVPLVTGRLLRRYNRFLADVTLDSGELVTAHVPNTGSMRSTREPGSRVALSFHPSPHRKLHWTLEMVESENCWVGVNTSTTNAMVEASVRAGLIAPLQGYPDIRREVKTSPESRIDLLLSNGDSRCFVEVKNVTWKEGTQALFPDAVTVRGTRHLRELQRLQQEGARSVIFFLVNRGDCDTMGPAHQLDPVYAQTLADVMEGGVEALAWRFARSLDGWQPDRRLPVMLP